MLSFSHRSVMKVHSVLLIIMPGHLITVRQPAMDAHAWHMTSSMRVSHQVLLFSSSFLYNLCMVSISFWLCETQDTHIQNKPKWQLVTHREASNTSSISAHTMQNQLLELYVLFTEAHKFILGWAKDTSKASTLSLRKEERSLRFSIEEWPRS